MFKEPDLKPTVTIKHLFILLLTFLFSSLLFSQTSLDQNEESRTKPKFEFVGVGEGPSVVRYTYKSSDGQLVLWGYQKFANSKVAEEMVDKAVSKASRIISERSIDHPSLSQKGKGYLLHFEKDPLFQNYQKIWYINETVTFVFAPTANLIEAFEEWALDHK